MILPREEYDRFMWVYKNYENFSNGQYNEWVNNLINKKMLVNKQLDHNKWRLSISIKGRWLLFRDKNET